MLFFGNSKSLDEAGDNGGWEQYLNERGQSHSSSISLVNLIGGRLSRGKSKRYLKFMRGGTSRPLRSGFEFGLDTDGLE
jgi:hypothetical protein